MRTTRSGSPLSSTCRRSYASGAQAAHARQHEALGSTGSGSARLLVLPLQRCVDDSERLQPLRDVIARHRRCGPARPRLRGRSAAPHHVGSAWRAHGRRRCATAHSAKRSGQRRDSAWAEAQRATARPASRRTTTGGPQTRRRSLYAPPPRRSSSRLGGACRAVARARAERAVPPLPVALGRAASCARGLCFSARAWQRRSPRDCWICSGRRVPAAARRMRRGRGLIAARTRAFVGSVWRDGVKRRAGRGGQLFHPAEAVTAARGQARTRARARQRRPRADAATPPAAPRRMSSLSSRCRSSTASCAPWSRCVTPQNASVSRAR